VTRPRATGFIYRGSPAAIAQSWELTLDFFARRLCAGVLR